MHMVSDTATPTPYLSLAQAARIQPPGRAGRPVHISTLVRWITAGSRGPDGATVRLQAVRMGGRWLTTRAWLDDYARRLTPAYGDESPRASSASRTRSTERAARELDHIGI